MADIATCGTCPAWRRMDGDMGQCQLYPDTVGRRNDRYCMQHPGNRRLMEPAATVAETPEPKPTSEPDMSEAIHGVMSDLLQMHGYLLHGLSSIDSARLEYAANTVAQISERIERLAADAWEQSAAGQQEVGQ